MTAGQPLPDHPVKHVSLSLLCPILQTGEPKCKMIGTTTSLSPTLCSFRLWLTAWFKEISAKPQKHLCAGPPFPGKHPLTWRQPRHAFPSPAPIASVTESLLRPRTPLLNADNVCGWSRKEPGGYFSTCVGKSLH